MKQSSYVAGILCLAILLGVFFANKRANIKIGVAGPMSGELAQYGQDMVRGATIAVEELNQEAFRINGRRVRFELAIGDDKASPEEGRAVAAQLVKGGIAGVVGHYNSGVSIAAAPIYAEAGIPQLALSANSRYTRLGLKTTYRMIASDERLGAALGQFIAQKLEPKTVYFVDDRTTFGKGLVAEVSATLKGRNIDLRYKSIDPANFDVAALVPKIAGSGSTALFFGGDERAGIPLLKAIRSAGSDAAFITGDAMCDESTLQKAHGAADRQYYCALAGIPPSWISSGIAFSEMYSKKYGAPPSNAALAYDAVHILAQAMQRARSSDPAVFLSAFREGSFDGKVQGVIDFDGRGDIKDSLVVLYRSAGDRLSEIR